MKIKLNLCFVFLISIVLVGNSYAQISGFDKVGTTSFQFLKVVPNARADAMGGASAATIQSCEAVFFNPAALTLTHDLDLSISYLDWFMDVSLTSLCLSYRVSNVGTFGFSAQISDMGDIEETRVDHLFRNDATGSYNPGLTGRKVSPGSQVFGLSYARQVTDKFSFGVTARFAREDLVEKAASAIVFDGGVIYRTGFKSLILGTMLRNFGPEVKYFDKSYPLPQAFIIGISGYFIGPENAFIFDTNDHSILFAYDLSQTRDHSQQHHLGFEYMLKNFLAIRTGYKFNFDEQAITVGFGINISRYRVNYSYNDFGEYLDAVHRFTIGFVIK